MSPTAGDLGRVIKACVQETLLANAHQTCPSSPHAEYYSGDDMPGGAAAVACGCGEVFDAPPLRPFGSSGDGPGESAPRGQVATQQPRDPVGTILPLIDPTQVYTPEQVESRILDCVARMEYGGMYERKVIEEAYATKMAYDMGYAKAHVLRIGGGSEKDRIALATVDCEDLFNAMTKAEMMRKAVAATMHNLRAALNGYQSVLKSINGSLPYGGSPGQTRG